MNDFIIINVVAAIAAAAGGGFFERVKERGFKGLLHGKRQIWFVKYIRSGLWGWWVVRCDRPPRYSLLKPLFAYLLYVP